MIRRAGIAAAFIACSSIAMGADAPPLEAYGKLPQVSLAALSPDGSTVAVRRIGGGRDLIMIFDLESGAPAQAVDAKEVNPRSVEFVGNESLLLRASDTVDSRYLKNAYEHTVAYTFNLDSGEIRVSLRNAKDIYPFQSGLGRVIGMQADNQAMFMPAYVDDGRGGAPTYGFYRVPVNHRSERLLVRGTRNTIDWFVDGDGNPIVREDFNDSANTYKLVRYDGRKRVTIFEEEDVERPALTIVGMTPDRESLVIRKADYAADVDKYHLMNIADGFVSEPILGSDEKDVDHVLTDLNRNVLGVRYTGFKPTYEFLDPTVDRVVRRIQARLGDVSAELVDWSDDFETMLFYVSGSWTAGSFLLFRGPESQPVPIGHKYPDFDRSNIAHVRVGEYQASDGLMIPMLLTGKLDVIEAGNAPLVVMPHGGPGAHDVYGFDWMAQYFASRGYVVLQPQFRGSTGFGNAHYWAGNGEWGGKMQTDLDDGVQFLVDEGIADANRACIVGASYGGYAALAAGAFSPLPYRCVVSVAGVTDLVEMLRQEKYEHGSRDWVLDYWEDKMGGTLKEKELLNAISPAQHADKFRAPVLLIHGRDDTVVKRAQSRLMEKALKKADKEVTYELMKGEDHWLTQEETRLEALRLMSEFVEKHNPVD